MATLFQIDEQLQNCVKLTDSENYVDTTTGEIIDTAAIEQLEMDRETKIRNIACWIRNLESDEKQLTEQEKIFNERKNACKNKRESLKAYLAAFLNGKKWENNEVKISWRKSESVEITAPVKTLPEIYLKYADPKPDKTLLKKDIKAGKVIPGAVLVEKNNMQIK